VSVKKLLFLADTPSWVFDSHRREISKRLTPEYETQCVYRDIGFPKDPKFYDAFDCVYVMDTRLFERNPPVPRDKTCVGIRCEFSWKNEGADKHYARYVKDRASVFHVVCRAHQDEFAKVDPSVLLVQHGIDLRVFNVGERIWRDSGLVVGVAGNPRSGGDKGFDVVKRACEVAGCELKYAEKLSRDEMADFYRSLDVLCIASASEGQNNPTMEAMACGTPVVSTRVGAAAEMVSEEFLVDRDAKAFADVLADLKMDDSSRREFIGRQVSAKMVSWSWDVKVESFKYMFETTMNGKK